MTTETFEPNPKPLSDQTPREIDTQLAHWDEQARKLRFSIEQGESFLGRMLERCNPWDKTNVDNAQKNLQETYAKLATVHAEITRLSDEFYRRNGWKRYFLVFGGHVHRERNCSTCRWNTLFGWLPELSDCDESAMVEVHGDNACAVCFPEVLMHPAYIKAAKARAAFEAKQAAGLCPKSGKDWDASKADARFRPRYIKCPECGAHVPLTSGYKYRQHKRPEPKKAKTG